MESSTSPLKQQELPKNNMSLSVVATVLGLCSPCCIGLILGVIAIVMANSVKKKFEANDIAGAEKAAKNAKILALVAIALTVLNLIYTGVMWESTMDQYRELMEQYGIESNF